ncbi:MAG: hypothetical protein EOP48_13710 [Sphingobacteriales bacterium]|nr:MAG: hypothetical protein EOP48_13710 [Sphingobacteriales bacterium]
MKNLLGFLFLLVLASCSEKLEDFIPGTYLNSAGGEFSIADDTLTITSISGNNFKIQRKTGYQLIRNGKAGKREYSEEISRGVFNSEPKILLEMRSGKLITFSQSDNALWVGQRKYLKIN